MASAVKYDPSRVTKRRKEEHQSATSGTRQWGRSGVSVVVSHGDIRDLGAVVAQELVTY